MSDLVMRAYEKLQKREHLLRIMRHRLEMGRITEEVFRQSVEDIDKSFRLTADELLAYEQYNKRFGERK